MASAPLILRQPESHSAYWAFAVLGPLALYGVFLGLAAVPFLQRQAIYAHKFHTLWWNDVNEPEKWGFARHQAIPFNLTTSDGQSLYCWHILPLSVYSRHEKTLAQEPPKPLDHYPSSLAFRLLKEDPEARLILSFHGNAGHVAQNARAPQYHLLTGTSNWHVIALDYRGFGHSTGSPTEGGLITDACALVDFAIDVLGIPSRRIVLLGQSLGTAVAAAVAERYSGGGGGYVDFAGVVLVAPFTSLPTMLAEYSIAGVVPILRPLMLCPPLLRFVLSRVVDKWKSLDRLVALVNHMKEQGGRLRLSLIHAANDQDIPCHESERIFDAVANATVVGEHDSQLFFEMKNSRTMVTGKNAFKIAWVASPDIVISYEQFAYGGHNDIMVYAPVLLALRASFDEI